MITEKGCADAYNELLAENDLLQEAAEKKQMELIQMLSWFTHYIKDHTWERITPDKDFELREALKKAEDICK